MDIEPYSHKMLSSWNTSHIRKKMFTGKRDRTKNMWSIDLGRPPPTTQTSPSPVAATQHANNVYDFTIKRDIVRYLHRGASSPVPLTWCAAIDIGNFATWPGLTSWLVRKHLQKSVPTTKGHMRQIRQHIRSTKPKQLAPTLLPCEMMTTSSKDVVRQNIVTV